MREASAPVVNAYRAQEGLAPLRDPLGTDGFSPQLALYAVSRHLVRPSPRWPAHHQVVGYFFLEPQKFVPDAELSDFLEEAEPPVVIGFGSMVHEDPKAVAATVLEAVQLCGARAVIQRGWSGLSSAQVPSSVRMVDFIPHSWLFSKSSAVVHHGGAGTTAAAFRAGVPAVVVPHTLEQPLWAEYARALNAAVVLPWSQLSAQKLAEALTKARSTPALQEGARIIAEKIRAEEGVVAARRLIEQHVAAKKHS